MIDWIQGEKFQDIADHRYAPPIRHSDDYCRLVNDLDFKKLKSGDIIYTHAFYVKQLFEILELLGVKVYVISHNGDDDADFAPPDNVLHWYSQNVMIQHPRVTSIPLGVENNKWCVKQNKLKKMELRLQSQRSRNGLVYMNFNIANYPSEREHVYRLFENKSWVTSVRGKNGMDFDGYLEGLCNHKYVLCPRGSSNNCHRRWESLYMGAIPIVRRDINNAFYSDMPILYVDKWEEVTTELLNDFYKTRIFVWDLVEKQLTFTWWKNKILKDCDHE